MNENIIFIGWDGFDQRNEAYCQILNAKCIYIEKYYPNIVRKVFSWFTKTIKTFNTIRKLKPKVVIVKNTHFIIGAVTLLFRRIFRYKLVYDSHNSSFINALHYPQFIHKYLATKSDLYLVTNKEHEKILISWGAKVQLVHFPPIKYDKNKFNDYKTSENFNICYINTYSFDEPYSEVIEAVRDINNIHLYITGNTKKSRFPLVKLANVTHTGFISRADYLGLLNNCDAIMVLTTRENTMQKGGNEAVYLEKPVITTDNDLLRTYFSKGTVYVKNDSKSIKEGILQLMENYSKMHSEIKLLKEDLENKNLKSVNSILDLLD